MDPAAYACYERINKNPDDAEALSALWDYHGGRAEFQQLATIVETTAGRRSDPRSSADLYFRAAELWSKNVGRADRAVANYTRAFEKDPSQLAAIEAARQIYLQLGNYKLAAQLLERQLAATQDVLVRQMLLREGAELQGRLGNVDLQIRWLEEIAEADPEDWELRRELAGAHITRSLGPAAQPDDARRAASLLASLAQSVGGEHGLAFAEAALDAWPGDEAAFALIYDAYGAQERLEELAVRQIAFVQANPTSPYTPVVRRALAEAYLGVGQIDDAIAALEPLVDDDPEVARQVLGLYRDAGRADDFARLAESFAATAEPSQQIRDLKDLAEISGRTGNRAAMLSAMRKVLALDAADPEALALVEDDLRASGDYGALRDVLAEAVRSDQCPADMRIPRLREIAQVSLERLDDPQAALDAWREIVDSVGEDHDALAGIDRVLAQLGRWEELAPVLAQRADVLPEGDERLEVLRRMADLHRDRTGDRAAEASAVARLWQADPGDDAVSLRLVALRRATGSEAGVVEVLRSRAERASDDEAVARWTELAVALEAMRDASGAVAAWRSVLEHASSHETAWEELERLLREQGAHDERYAAIVARAEALEPGEARAALHARASDAARAMGDPATALREAERAVAMDPSNESLVTALMDSLEVLGERARLLAFVRERAAGLPDGMAKVDLTRRAARAVGQTDPAGAAKVWEEVREGARRAGAGDDAEALDALLGLAELAGDTERVVALLADAADATTDVEARRGLRMRRARILADELGRVDEGLDVLEATAREEGEAALATWEALEALAATHGSWARSYAALEAQVDLTQDDDDRIQRATRLVELAQGEASLQGRVLDAMRVQHRVDPGDLGLVQSLADLCERDGAWAEAAGLLEELAEMEGDEEELSRLVQRVAVLADEHLDEPARAWKALLPQAQAGDIACLDLLIGLSARREMHAEVVPVLTDLAMRVSDGEARASLWREIASRKAGPLDDPAGALEAECEAMLAQPGEPAGLARIDDLAATARLPARIAAAYRAALEAGDDATAAHDLAMRGLASIEAAGGTAEALDFSLNALARMPADDELLDAVLRLAPGQERDQDLYVALDRRRRAAQSDGERLAVTLRAAELAGAALGDADTAFQYLEHAVALAVGRREPDEARLGEVAAMARRVDAERPEIGMLSALVQRLAERGDDLGESEPRGGAVLLRRAASLCDVDLALPDQALALQLRAVTLWPADEPAAAALEDLAGRQRRVPDVLALYKQLIDAAYDAATARAYTARRASLFASLGRVDDAIDAYQRLVEIAPRDLGVLHALQETLERAERWQPLLVALDRELEAGGDRVAILRRSAAIWERHLRNTFEARAVWRQVLRAVPDDPDARAALERLERRSAVIDDDDEPMVEEPTMASPAAATEALASLFGEPLSEAPAAPAPPAPTPASSAMTVVTPSGQRVNPMDRPALETPAPRSDADDPRAAFFAAEDDDAAAHDAAAGDAAGEVEFADSDEAAASLDVDDGPVVDAPPGDLMVDVPERDDESAGEVRASRPPPPLPRAWAEAPPLPPPPSAALAALHDLDAADEALEVEMVDEPEADLDGEAGGATEALSLDDLADLAVGPGASSTSVPPPPPPPFRPRRS